VKHYGDITQIKGSEVPIVDIVCGGSPCQDLSVAGKRAGLDGERSGLFMEQIRIIKEMRDYDRAIKGADVDIRLVRPRYMVWENVPGAFSSNKGEDFRCVLEETVRIVCKNAVIPLPRGGKWTPSGCIMGDGWSVAWRVHDAQFWGVPQRRKRIALVADFGGSSAPEILFERKGLSGNTEQSGAKGKEVAGVVGTDIKGTGAISFQERAGKPGGARESSYRTSEQEHCQRLTTNTSCLNPWDVQSKHIQPENGKAEALYSGECRGGGGEFYVLEGNGSRESHKGDGYKESDVMYTLNTVEQHMVCMGTAYDGSQVSPTITANNAAGQQRMPDKDNFNAVIAYGVDCYNQTQAEEVTQPLRSINADTDHIPCVYGIDRASFNQGKNALYDFSIEEEKAQTIVAKGPGGVMQSIKKQ